MVKRFNFFLVFTLLIGIVLMSLLAACQPAAPQASSQTATGESPASSAATAFPFPESREGLATVKGRLVVTNPLTSAPAQDDAIYLEPIPADSTGAIAPDLTDQAVQATVDETLGHFVIINLDVGKYMLVVRTQLDTIVPARTMDGSQIITVTIDESNLGQVIDLEDALFP